MARNGFNLDEVREFFKKKQISIKRQYDESSEKIVRDLYLKLLAETPKDKGRTLAGWNISWGSPQMDVPENLVTRQRATLGEKVAAHAQILARKKNDMSRALSDFDERFSKGEVLHIRNYTEYIFELEFGGHSNQAPNGWIRINIAKLK